MYDKIAQAYILLVEEFLVENRIDFLKKNNREISTEHDQTAPHKKAEDIIDHIANVGDPTKKKVHTQWMVNLYKKGAFRQEDLPRYHDALSNFEKYKHQLTPEQKDINPTRYSHISQLENVLGPHMGASDVSTKISRRISELGDVKGHTMVHDDPSIRIYRLDSKNASCDIYGGGHMTGGTSWCTASKDGERNMYDRYMKEYPGSHLYVVHRKADGEVFQYHTHSNQFMDKEDKEISPDDFKSIAPSLHKAWKEKPELLD